MIIFVRDRLTVLLINIQQCIQAFQTMFQIQKLTKDNRELQQKIRTLNSELQCSKNDFQMQKLLIKKSHDENNRLVLEIKQLKRREEENKRDREEMEARYLNVLTKLEDQVTQKENKYRKLQAKVQPLMNHDSVRLQILTEVQSVHGMEVEQLTRKCNNLKDQILRLKRQNYLQQHRIEQNKMQSDDQIRKVKNQAARNLQSNHFNNISYQMCNEIENRLLVNYQQSKKQLEYYKDKYFSTEKRYLQKIENLQQELSLWKDKCKFYEMRRQNN